MNKLWYVIGSHTIGDSRCTSFRQRLYNQTGNGKADFTLDQQYAAVLRTSCPRSGGDQNLFVLDFVTPLKFDNFYYKNLLANKGLLSSDEILLTKNQESADLVRKYAERNDLFFEQFAKSMVKMGNITPLTGSRGEIRKNCRKINKWWSNVIVMYHMWKLHLDFTFLSIVYRIWKHESQLLWSLAVSWCALNNPFDSVIVCLNWIYVIRCLRPSLEIWINFSCCWDLYVGMNFNEICVTFHVK